MAAAAPTRREPPGDDTEHLQSLHTAGERASTAAADRAQADRAGVEERDVFPALYRANRPAELDRAASEAGLVPVAVRQVATLHRYAGMRRWLRRLLRLAERPLRPSRRSTIVVLYRSE